MFGGSNAVLLRRAIEETGGFCEGTLTEDYATGLKMQKAGYRAITIISAMCGGRISMI
ncbi:MAG: glycosyltransferase family 2 protein [Suilimivivens sp.]